MKDQKLKQRESPQIKFISESLLNSTDNTVPWIHPAFKHEFHRE
jgi:hypothetical protein